MIKKPVTVKELKQELVGDVVIKFGASWCNPCVKLTPIYDKVANFTESKTFLSIDIDASPEIAELYEIESVPTLVFQRDNKILHKFSGVPSELKLKETINSVFSR